MAKIIKTKIDEQSLLFVVDCLVEDNEYQPFKQRIADQFIKNIEVKGFRKGKAPAKLALEKVDPTKLQEIIVQETIYKFYPELQPKIIAELKKLNRISVDSNISVDPSCIQEGVDGFEFRIALRILPKIDLKKIKDIEIEFFNADEIKNRLSKKEFFEREKTQVLQSLNKFTKTNKKSTKNSQLVVDLSEQNLSKKEQKKENKEIVITLGIKQFPPDFEKEIVGLKEGEEKTFALKINLKDLGETEFKYVIKIIEVREPQYKNIEELLESSEELKKKLKSEKKLEETLDKIYDQETEEIINSQEKNEIVKALIQNIPDFSIDEQKYHEEAHRIYNVLEHQAQDTDKSVAEVFATSGLPGSEKKLKSNQEVNKAVHDYVYKEFKLMGILQAVYFEEVDEKIQDSEITTLESEIKQNPRNFSVTPDVIKDPSKLKSIAYDRLLRSKAYRWIKSQVKLKTSKKTTKKLSPDSKIKTKKTSTTKTKKR